jgi:quinolinate synthase
MNSDAELKAFCGRHGGAVCTSSNAVTALKWGFSRSQKILFFPDQHLGRNSANLLGLAEKERIVWQPGKPLGGNRKQDIERAKIILWDGYCHVHTKFTPEHIRHARQTYPEAKIIVHPECPEEVVNLADASGSTSQIVSYVKNSSQADTILIGTEINLIERLALENTDKSIRPLTRSVCPNMAKINLRNLLETLENLGRKNIVTIEKHIKQDAQKALDRMLALKP